MESASLDDFVAFNTQLAALVEADVPLDIGLSNREASATQELGRINATVIRRVKRGESLMQALEGDEQDVPAAYRAAVQFGLRTNNLPGALEGSSRVAESAKESRNVIETAAVYPLVVCMLAYLGLVGFSIYLGPTLAEMYGSLGLLPGPGLRVLSLLRESLPYWVAIPPVILLATVGWWKHCNSRGTATGAVSNKLLRWLPGASRIVFEERCARFASSLAALLGNQVQFSDALLISGDVSGDERLTQGARSLAAEAETGQPLSDSSPAAKRFPPFLRWAIWHSEATTGRAQALEIAARMYHEASERRAQRLRTIAPLAVLVLVGGTVTLLYGLALFIPMVELLRSLARG